ncbi:hypothetical protein [Pedobacter arcticus]|uniref:hypothetical protein n=1 Tax=Pedobacter arcticus TaxID=752140 RepID=UPI0012B5F595|nr:hypothetical protein [Pedobacter arcticus]
MKLSSKFEKKYNSLPISEKESYKWIEVSRNTKSALESVAEGIIIVQDRRTERKSKSSNASIRRNVPVLVATGICLTSSIRWRTRRNLQATEVEPLFNY